MTAVYGTSVDITTQDGTADAYLVHPDDGSRHPAVLLYMEVFGLRPHLEKMADRITAEAYFGHADQDRSLPPEQIDRLDKALAAAGLRYRTEVSAGAHHGYTQADTADYDAEAAERHWTALLALLRRAM